MFSSELIKTARELVNECSAHDVEVWKSSVEAIAGWLTTAPAGSTPRTCSAELLVALCAIEEAQFQTSTEHRGEVH